MHYFLDGYNLLFQLFGGISELREEREQLLEELDSSISQTSLNLTIVFDAHLRDEQLSRTKFRSLDIIFTDFGQTADDYILEALNLSKHPKRETIITNDQRLAWRARGLGAKTQSLSQFLKQLEKPPKQIKKSREKKIVLPSERPKLGDFPGTIDYYLDIFEKRYRDKEE